MTLSFIIVNYRSEKYLSKCIESILSAKLSFPFEIIVVHNDDTCNPPILPNNIHIKLIVSKKNAGYGSANNLGAKSAKGKYLSFLNPDTILLKNHNIPKLLDCFSDNDIAIIGPKLVINENGNVQPWCAGFKISPLDTIKNNLGIKKSRKIWESNTIVETDWVSGAALFIKRHFFEEIAGFDENYFMYFEDADLCNRTKAAGKKVVFFPPSNILHYNGKSSTNKSSQKKMFYKSQDYYFKKHFGNPTAIFMQLLRNLFH